MMKPACVWNWDVLLYEYYIIPTDKPDLGGFGALRGVSARASGSGETESISFDDALPRLPEDAVEVGSGEVCVGELYSKPLGVTYARLDYTKLDKTDITTKRVLGVFERANTPRNNPKAVEGPSVSTKEEASSDKAGELIYLPDDTSSTVFESLLPIATGVGAGLALYRYVSEDMRLRDVLLVWSAGTALGLAIGQEVRRSRYIRGG